MDLFLGSEYTLTLTRNSGGWYMTYNSNTSLLMVCYPSSSSSRVKSPSVRHCWILHCFIIELLAAVVEGIIYCGGRVVLLAPLYKSYLLTFTVARGYLMWL